MEWHHSGTLWRRVQPVSSVNLALSLLFGLGQIVVGFLLVSRGRRQWRRAGVFVMMLAGAWFVCSGTIEIFVSGMETLQRVGGVPDRSTFIVWRGRADTALAMATGALVLVGIAVAISGKLSWRRN